MRIGFFGLGNMGGPMAANFAKAGHEVAGFDVAGLSVPGVTQATDALDAIKGSDVVITMLPNGKILRSVYDEIVLHAGRDALLIDCSTVDVESALDSQAKARSHGIEAVDAPVSGGIAGAVAGTLTFMVGGSDAAFARSLPVLNIIGRKAVHCGAAGAGQAAKICNNMILGVSMIAVCEAFVLADRLGLGRDKLFDVVSTSSGSCWSMNTYCPTPGVGPTSPADNDYKPGFAAELMLKDLRLSQTAAARFDAATPLGAAATDFYSRFVESGGLGKDFSAILPWLSAMARGEKP